jgi:hypothetical protein
MTFLALFLSALIGRRRRSLFELDPLCLLEGLSMQCRFVAYISLPCVEKVDPGLALFDFEQRFVVGRATWFKLLYHLDLKSIFILC